MLCDLQTLKAVLQIPAANTSADTALQALLPLADRAVKRYCKRELEQANYVWTLNGPGSPELPLPQRPLTCYLLSGTLTSGSAVVSNLTVAGNLSSLPTLIPGMPVAAAGGAAVTTLANDTTIQTVNNSTQITLSGNATASGTFTLLFGLNVWIDPSAMAGFGTGTPFSQTVQLMVGRDYLPKLDQGDGATSVSGLLLRLGGLLPGVPGGGWGFDYWPGRMAGGGTLTASRAPRWPRGYGNIKVRATCGYAGGANIGSMLPETTAIPPDLTLATAQLAAWAFHNAPTGGVQTSSESLEDYSVALAGSLQETPGLGSTRQLLGRFREYSVAPF